MSKGKFRCSLINFDKIGSIYFDRETIHRPLLNH